MHMHMTIFWMLHCAFRIAHFPVSHSITKYLLKKDHLHHMEHLPWVKPKSERYFRSQSATDYGMQPSDEFNMECGHGDTLILPDMEHPIESMPKLQRTEKRDMLLEEETRNDLIYDSQFESVDRSQFESVDRSQFESVDRLDWCKDFWLHSQTFWLPPLKLRESTEHLQEKHKRLEENQKRWEKSTRQLEENQKRLRKSTKQLEENQKRLRKSTKQLEENQQRLEESTRQLEKNQQRLKEIQKRSKISTKQSKTSTKQLRKSIKQLEESRKRIEENQKRMRKSKEQLEESTRQLEEIDKRLEENKKRLEESARQLEESRKRLEENQKRLEESTWQLEESSWQLEESTWQLEGNKKRLEESTRQLEESTRQFEGNKQRLEESTRQIEQNEKRLEESTRQTKTSTKQGGTRRLVQPHQERIAPKYKPRPQLTTSWILSKALIMMQLVGLCFGATGNTDCLTTQSVLLGSQGIIRCRLFENSTRFFWYDTNNEGGNTLLIKLENGRVGGTGYTSGEFNIDSDGSLIINSVTVQHERVFRFQSLSPNLIGSTNGITVIVYVEPIEPIPVVTECLGKSDCIMKGNLDGVISCVHHNTRPAATISWFMRDGTHDIPLNSTTNQTLSADLITFSVTSEVAIGEIPLLVNKQSLVLLVCKSHNPYSVVQESDSKVLLDISQNDPFEKQPDLPEDPVYTIQNQDLVLECPLTIAAEDSIVMWMAKSLETKNRRYLKYSAYGVFPSMETDEQSSLDKNGDLVISQVGLQDEGLFACVQSTGNNTKSFLQRVEVIVQPTPSKVLVEGCKIFQPCSFYITETKTITCEVNGVHPKVELKMKALSTTLAVINTEVSTYEDEGLFYTSIRGYVIVVDDSCHENGTIICQAVGPAANIFKSDAYITISSHGEKCSQISAAPFPADKAVQTSSAYLTFLTIAVAFLFLCFVFLTINAFFTHWIIHRHM